MLVYTNKEDSIENAINMLRTITFNVHTEIILEDVARDKACGRAQEIPTANMQNSTTLDNINNNNNNSETR